MKKIKIEIEYKTYKERAEYLGFINPMRAEMYSAIADFFGENEIPPLPKVLQRSRASQKRLRESLPKTPTNKKN